MKRATQRAWGGHYAGVLFEVAPVRYVVPADELLTVIHTTTDGKVTGCRRPMAADELWMAYPYDPDQDTLCPGCDGLAPAPPSGPDPLF